MSSGCRPGPILLASYARSRRFNTGRHSSPEVAPKTAQKSATKFNCRIQGPTRLTTLAHHHYRATPLMAAIICGNFEMAAALMDEGALLHLKNGRGKTVPQILFYNPFCVFLNLCFLVEQQFTFANQMGPSLICIGNGSVGHLNSSKTTSISLNHSQSVTMVC